MEEKNVKKTNFKKSLARKNVNTSFKFASNFKKFDLNNKIPTYVYALGGIGEVGKNMYVVEEGDELWIIDAGIMFSNTEIAGTEGIIQSYEHLYENKHKIKGLIITHGHEDHIGGIPYLIRSLRIPLIYAPRIATKLIQTKIRDKAPGRRYKMQVIDNASFINSNNFKITFFNVNHSIPDCLGISFNSKRNGTIVTTGDFKFDLSPIGDSADFYRMSRLAHEGVTLLLSDSTNSLSSGFSISEKIVAKNLDDIIGNANGRIIIASFSSNIYRIKSIMEIAIKYNRKIAIFGRSMERNAEISRKMKYIEVGNEHFVKEKEIKKINDKDLLIICTGSQGESLAALSKISNKKHKSISIKQSDIVIFSSSPIPGNLLAVEKVVNKLVKQGATVIENEDQGSIHASGHGYKEEQKLMLSILKPKYFFPIHGEYRMLLEHSETAKIVGIPEEKIFIGSNGYRLKVLNGIVSQSGTVPADNIYIDGKDIGGVTDKTISDRTKMGKHGVVSITIGIDARESKITYDPILISSGCFNVKENKDIIQIIQDSTKDVTKKYFNSGEKITFSGIKNIIRSNVEELVFKYKKREPIVVPVILSTNLYQQEDDKLKQKS